MATSHNDQQRIALVTGASGGLGLEICLALQFEGFKVTAATRDPERFKERIAQHIALHTKDNLADFETLALDLSLPEQAEETVKNWCEQVGRLDVLVNNAGFAAGGLVEDVPIEMWRSQMEVNVFGLIAATKGAIPTMRGQRGGKMINISSISGLVGLPGFGPYATSKFAVEGFSESLRHELRSFGVQVVLVELGAYDTPIWENSFKSMSEPKLAENADMFHSLKKRVQQTAANAGDPSEAARHVARIATMRRTRMRYVIGQSTSVMHRAKTYLPWKLWERIIDWAMFGKRK